MRILISAVLLILAIACSSFEPVTCYGTYMPQLRYDDAVEVRKGNRYGDCFEIRGTVKQAVDGGYIVRDVASTWDVYIRWEGKPKPAKGDFIVAVVAATMEPPRKSFKTASGSERIFPAFHGSRMELRR